MKKLMMAAAIVCAAGLANAASMAWGTNWVYAEGDGVDTYVTGSAGDFYVLYLGTSSDVSGISFDGTTVTGATVWDAAKGGKGTFADGLAAGTITGLDSTYNGSYFALLTFDTDNQLYGVSDAAVVSGIVDSPVKDATAASFSNFYHSGDAADYQLMTQSVPEPTSGLLLLLGVAGLALRRRRA